MPSGVTIDFTANLARFSGTIDRATADLNRFQSNASRVSNQVKSAFAGLGIGISVVGFTSFIKSAIDAADNINDLNKRLGISVETLAGLKLVADTSGTSLDGLASVLQKLTVRLGEAASGNEDLAALTGALGLQGLTAEQAFIKLADILTNNTNINERNVIANKLFGRSYADLLPALSEGSAGLQKLIDRGKELNPITQEMAKNADIFNDSITELKGLSSQVGVSIANSLLPSLNDTVKAMLRLQSEGNSALAVLRGFAGIGKLPFDFFLPDNDFSIERRIKGLRLELGDLQRSVQKKPLGTGLLGELVYGSNDELNKRIEVTKNQIASLEKFKDKVRPPIVEPVKNPLTQTDSPLNANSGADAAKKIATERQKIFDENRKQEERNRGVDFEIEFGNIEQSDEIFRKQRDRIAGLRTEFIDLIDPINRYVIKLEEIGEAERAGALSAEQASEARFRINEAIDGQLEYGKVLKDNNSIAADAGKVLSNSLDSAVLSGRKFSDILKTLVLDLARLALQRTFTQNLGGGSGSGGSGIDFGKIFSSVASFFASADGNVFNSRALSAYSGQIVSKPTVFPFASGIGLMGEAGPEAILPLKRGGDGKLGVALNGGGDGAATIVQNVYVTINSDGQSNTTGDSDSQTTQFANQLVAAIKGVLINEKRAGGLLS